MVSKVRRSVRVGTKRVSYALMERFSEQLICGRCFRQNVRKPVRQVLSSHHRPLPLCRDCSNEVFADHRARVLKFN